MKQYRDLFIDFDDTLYDTHGNAVAALGEIFEYFHLEQYFDDPEMFYDDYWHTNIDLWTRYAKGEITRDFLIVERFRHPLLTSEKFRAAKADSSLSILHFSLEVGDKFLDYCSNKPGVVEGAHELMDYLRQRGYHMHMTSNGFHEVQYKKLAACGLTDYFDTVILSEDAGVNKPAKEYFDYALRVSKARKETTIMIGDNFSTDIMGAKNAGLDTIYFNRYPDYPAPDPVTFEVKSLLEIKNIL